jgi:hypothetical protein
VWLGRMHEIICRFDDSSIEALTLLANSDIHVLCADVCEAEIGKSLLWVKSIAIPLDCGGVVSLNIALHEFGTDNYFAQLSARTQPGEFDLSSAPVRIRLWKTPPRHSFCDQRVEKVSVLSRREHDEDEVAICDAGIELLMRDGSKILVAWPGPNGAGFWLALSAEDNSRVTAGLEVRLVITRTDSVTSKLSERPGLVTVAKLSDGRVLKIFNATSSWTRGVQSDHITINISPAPLEPHIVASFESDAVESLVAEETGAEIYRRQAAS